MEHPRDRILVFDVNETLLDMEVLDAFFGRAFGDAQVKRQWFTGTILYSQALSLTGTFISFDALSVAVLRMLAQTMHISLHERDCNEFSQLLSSATPHSDVPEALERLADAGFAMVALTNSGRQPSAAMLERSRISQHFDRIFSVEEVRRYSPRGRRTDSLPMNLT